MKLAKYKIFIRIHWLKIISLIITIGAGAWAYTGYTDLKLAYEALSTPAQIIFPTPYSAISYPTTITNSAITELVTATPVPGSTTPLIPSELTEFLGEDLYPILIEGEGWRLTDLHGKLYYYWDEESSKWLALPEVTDRYCIIPLVSSRKKEAWDTVCYLDFSGLGIILDEGFQSGVIITKDGWGNIKISEESNILYELSLDPLHGYQWIETSKGYIKRISAATKIISEIDPRIYINDIDLPAYIARETYFTDKSLIARYIGSANHQIMSEDGKSLGSVKLHLFARNKDVLFWISGEGQVIGVNIGLPFQKRYIQLRSDIVEYLADSTEVLAPNNRYEFVYFASKNVVPNSDLGLIDLSKVNEIMFIENAFSLPQTWMTKQLLLMLYIINYGTNWITDFNGELETSPPSIVPFYYIKTP